MLRAAREAGDTATQVMLQWFVAEQVEEERNAGLAVDQLRLNPTASCNSTQTWMRACFMISRRRGFWSAAVSCKPRSEYFLFRRPVAPTHLITLALGYRARMTSTASRRMVGIGFAIGVVTGVFGGLVGLGGGVLMIPLLTGWARLTQHDAHATSLAAIIAAGISGSITYAHAGALDWSAALLLASVATVATYAAAHYSRRIHAFRLRRMFGVFLFVAAVLLVLKDEILMLSAPVGALEIVFLLGSGLLVGVTSGLLGVGGGALMVPLLVIALDMPQHVAQGTSLAAMVPAAVSGTAAHVRNRKVRFGVLLGLIPGISLGTWLGGTLALALPTAALRLILALVLALMSVHHLHERAGPRVAAMKTEER